MRRLQHCSRSYLKKAHAKRPYLQNWICGNDVFEIEIGDVLKLVLWCWVVFVTSSSDLQEFVFQGLSKNNNIYTIGLNTCFEFGF